MLDISKLGHLGVRVQMELYRKVSTARRLRTSSMTSRDLYDVKLVRSQSSKSSHSEIRIRNCICLLAQYSRGFFLKVFISYRHLYSCISVSVPWMPWYYPICSPQLAAVSTGIHCSSSVLGPMDRLMYM